VTDVVCVGLATLDTIYDVPFHPDPDGRVVATELAVAGGGPAATAAVAVARLGLSAAFAGAVGDDEVGAAVRDGLASEGVDLSALAVVPGARSPQSSVLVERDTGGRTIVHYPGTVPPVELSPRARELCREATWVHVDHVGYGAVRRDARDVKLSVDGGNAIDGLELDGVALYAPTERALRERFGDAEAALAAGAALVVVTRGADGSFAVTRDGETVEAPSVAVDPVVSTLGAGDVFHGALLAFLVRGEPFAGALRGANAVAALSTRALDGRSAIPTRSELGALG
jgi:sugar/nucleoside kinase (ribokinase family)